MIETSTLEKAAEHIVSRRRFFGITAALAGAGLLVTPGCKKSDDPGLAIGTGDTSVMNYVYVIEQLQAAFYNEVVTLQATYTGGNAWMSALELIYFTDIRNHEVAHREYFKNILANSAIIQLDFDFSTIDFRSRTSVLETAIFFKDISIAAYNGIAYTLASSATLTMFGKISSVEARHSAALHDLRLGGTFATSGPVEAYTGMDVSKSSYEVINQLSPFIKTKFDVNQLPS